ncbi:precorrin-3B C17-methyltransferase [Thiorhodococcus drewsii AZ1]|uniref:Precorrin-3B C17-methyltransferase n=1 Tax=Thiorhodococcus drewsii AZ1 TaxID=765913 RepID=G2DZE8_9GAMM|nr:precorrin-3B C(17)-methyltransferase [Thiorhodococcus drewsii]EGV32175.1 precorrin-3B C17-methyltransferase [Thiorhodococcus drewsii AZ1]
MSDRGKLFLVGLGPGDPALMAARAREAIAESDLVIGYARYLDLIEDLLRGKEVLRKGMTEEVERCVAACREARGGRRVALVSSGDAGVYGMAGLAYEVLLQSGWTPEAGIPVEVVPGITAVTACAALVGAPLSHDFCAISLSDLLTPWPLISRRLESAGRGDFVVALYNPRSGRRRRQLLEARDILLRHRRPDTPVAIVSSAYREGQSARLSTLAAVADGEVGMLSSILVGNSRSEIRAGLLITPRGYDHKYDAQTGGLRDGECPGRSLSLGLDGWRDAVRRVLHDVDAPSPWEVACRFEVALGEILSAVAEAPPSEGVGELSASSLGVANAGEIVEILRDWGELRLDLGHAQGAAFSLLVRSSELLVDGSGLRLERTGCGLELDWSRVGSAWLVGRGRHRQTLYLLDHRGDPLLEIAAIEGRHPSPGPLMASSR